MNAFGRISAVGLSAAALWLAPGCRLEERMAWSPDGTRAAVWSADGLRLADTNGVLSPSLASDVTFAAWLPDGRGLVVLRAIAATNWGDIVRLAPRAETGPVEALAGGLAPAAKAVFTMAGGDEDAMGGKFIEPLNVACDDWAIAAAAICLRDTRPEALKDALHALTNAAEVEKGLSESEVAIHEISVLRLDGGKSAGAPLVIERSMAGLSEPRPSPSAPVLAFLKGSSLIVAPLHGGTNRWRVADKVSGSFDWTPDGRSLAFAVRQSEKWEENGINLAHVQQQAVIGRDGAPALGENRAFGFAAFPFLPRVRCLPDGRVFFAGAVLQFPAIGARGESRFFIAGPEGAASNRPAVVAVAGEVPSDLAGYAVSPDGRRVAIAEAGSDAVALLDLAGGRLDVISPSRGAKSRTLPAWRGPHELFYAALPAAGAKRPAWMRWSGGASPAVFSGGWSEEAVRGLLEMNQGGDTGAKNE